MSKNKEVKNENPNNISNNKIEEENNNNISQEQFRKLYGINKIKEDLLNDKPKDSILKNGKDLTNFGLDLYSKENLIDTFGSPFENQRNLPFQIELPVSYKKLSIIKS